MQSILPTNASVGYEDDVIAHSTDAQGKNEQWQVAPHIVAGMYCKRILELGYSSVWTMRLSQQQFPPTIINICSSNPNLYDAATFAKISVQEELEMNWKSTSQQIVVFLHRFANVGLFPTKVDPNGWEIRSGCKSKFRPWVCKLAYAVMVCRVRISDIMSAGPFPFTPWVT